MDKPVSDTPPITEENFPKNVHSLLKYKLNKYLDKALKDINEKGRKEYSGDFCDGVEVAITTIKEYINQQIA